MALIDFKHHKVRYDKPDRTATVLTFRRLMSTTVDVPHR